MANTMSQSLINPCQTSILPILRSKKEIAKITKFWLDKGVSGFRLDAVGFYFSNDDKKTTAFTKWLTDTVKKQNPKAYLVGEVFFNGFGN